MQTREPGKRVNSVFVLILIIIVPIIIITLFMMNTVPKNPPGTTTFDSTITGSPMPDSLKADSTNRTLMDSTNRVK